MNKTFTFHSEILAADLECEVTFSCSDRDGADCVIDELLVQHPDGRMIDLGTHDHAESAKIEHEAQDLADENACEAYQDGLEGAADAAYDNWRDLRDERGE